ncbi:MAG: tyrosine-type recombinase/integrase [Anaerolineae bacterium]
MATPLLDRTLRLISHEATLRQDMGVFLTDCRSRNLAPRTLAIYTHQLDAFLAWAGNTGTDALTAQHLRQYMLHLQEEGHNPGGQHQAFRVLRTFFRWLAAEGLLDANPMERLKPPRMREEPLPPVPLADVAAMLATCKGRNLLDLRDSALLLTLLDSAARASELLAVNVEDVDMTTGALILRLTKNGKQRVTFLGTRSRKALWRYLRYRKAEAAEPLFASDAGGRLSYAGLRQVLRRRAERAGVREPGAHAFRRAACLALLRNGADVFTVQALAGHADLATTRRYLQLVTEDLRVQHAAHSPADRMLR